MQKLTQIKLEAIRKRADAATEGPWDFVDDLFVIEGDGMIMGNLISKSETVADAEFIAHSREDIPVLLAEVERLRETISWGISCAECSNQLAEDWEMVGSTFLCWGCFQDANDEALGEHYEDSAKEAEVLANETI